MLIAFLAVLASFAFVLIAFYDRAEQRQLKEQQCRDRLDQWVSDR